MRYLLILFVFLTACSSNPTLHNSTSQNYRPKGAEDQIRIDASIARKAGMLNTEYAAIFQIDGKPALFFQLDKSGNGSFSCNTDTTSDKDLYHCYPHDGNKIGAQCIGSTLNRKLKQVHCTFTYDNEIAANFLIK